MNFKELNPVEKSVVATAVALPTAYAVYWLALELWCVAYGFGMQLGLL